MSQISPPFRIALIAMLAACALWFTVLRPKPPAADPPLPAAPGTTGLAHDVAAAKGAGAASDAANGRVQAATGGTAAKAAPKPAAAKAAAGGTAAKSAPTTAAKPATATPVVATPKPAAATPKPAAPADPSTPLIDALDRDRAVVLVFWNSRGADDKAVRRAAQGVNRRHGRVLVKVAPISSVGRYTAITQGVQILEAPTALVLAPGGKARVFAGLTSTPELDQAVADALPAVKAGE